MTDGALQSGDLLGDYRLGESLGEGTRTSIWLADQLSMQRSVVLEILKSEAHHDPDEVEAFLADVRAKANVRHPGIGAVYEAVSNERGTFFARERLEGETLSDLHRNERKLTPFRIVKLLQQIAASRLYLEHEGSASIECDLGDLLIESGVRVKMKNLAVAGEPQTNVETALKHLLGAAFADMIKSAEPGETRVRSLLRFMADVDRTVALSWSQISTLSAQVIGQLEGAGGPPPPVPPPPPLAKDSFEIPPSFWVLLLGLSLIGGLVFFFLKRENARRGPALVETHSVSARITIPGGEHLLPDGTIARLATGFQINRTEVTISQYRDFLKAGNLEQYRHPEQPVSKKNHAPEGWETLWPAAVKGERWEGRSLSTDCPVFGVDWWDAYAFAKWEGSRLPTLGQWETAANFKGSPSASAAWGAVGSSDRDLTGAGLADMAGSVREWTRDLEVDPAFQLSPKKPVTVGGSFSKREKGVATRTWLDDRSERADDLGFRTITEIEPTSPSKGNGS